MEDKRERILAALNREQPDRIPMFELIVTPSDSSSDYLLKIVGKLQSLARFPIQKQILKGVWHLIGPNGRETLLRKLGITLSTVFSAGMITNAHRFNIDATSVILVPSATRTELVTLDLYKDEYGRLNKISGESLLWYEGGTLTSHEVLDAWGFPNPLDPLRINMFDAVAKVAQKKGIYLMPCIGGMMETLYEGVGIENFMYLLYDDPSFIRRIMDLQQRFLTQLATFLIDERGVEVVVFGDDSAYKSGPLMSVKHFEKYIFPRYKSIMNAIHRRGAKAIIHSDGYTQMILHGWIDAGVDGIHPWEPTAGWQLSEAKEKWGDKVCILGNIDCNTLTFGPTSRIRQEVLEAIRDAGPGGGYIMTSGNSIHSGIRPQHFQIMVDTCYKYGKYPLNLPENI